MTWDAEAANEKAEEFGAWLQDVFDGAAEDVRPMLQAIQTQWKAAYLVTGHKRLARALLKVDMGHER